MVSVPHTEKVVNPVSLFIENRLRRVSSLLGELVFLKTTRSEDGRTFRHRKEHTQKHGGMSKHGPSA